MAGSRDRVVEELTEKSVCRPPLAVRQSPIEGGGEQGMREADLADHALDDVRDQRRLERILGMSRGRQEVDRGHAEGGDERQRAARAFGQRRESSAYQLVQALRDRERLRRVDVHGQRSRELERVERIAARGLVDAE